MDLKELLETHQDYKQLKRIVDGLFCSFRSCDYAVSELSKAYDFLHKVEGKISEKKIKRIEIRLDSLETQFEDLWISGYLV